jgi:hypothetical protein
MNNLYKNNNYTHNHNQNSHNYHNNYNNNYNHIYNHTHTHNAQPPNINNFYNFNGFNKTKNDY